MKIARRPMPSKGMRAKIMANNANENIIEILSITADDGFFLTQKADVPIEEREVLTNVTTRSDYGIDEWKEITKEEAKIIQEQQDKWFEKTKQEYESNNNTN